MKFTFLQIVLLATLALPVAAQAQGTVRGAQEGAAVGNRDAGPVGAVVGGAVGAVTGTIGGILGIDDRPRFHEYVVTPEPPLVPLWRFASWCDPAPRRSDLLRHSWRVSRPRLSIRLCE